ncbi:hypothetical protein [Cerasicoccus arenae]|uniref:Uncharacterized protein n=1 Tax=Cerasicoccus arenae TaxID=424488 RepID=A0A8J3GD71_9BACT|nr:hypothetical protein [Cerasicoccus arenae]MBK1859027.1 hypothetical protein [Cerasicoccus arenae]GHB94807.1 hypothetical protein GCM10007047_07930 [Cerasicoccus arenae]
MPKSAPKLEWCIVRLGEDMNWWVEEISDDVHWDVDGLSIIDPRQVSHLMDLLEPLRDYDFQPSIFEDAFFKFRIERKLDDQRLRLVRTNDSLFESDDLLFALPDVIDEEKGPYADCIDHVTVLRVKLLNDLIEFEQKFTVEELEDDIREDQNADFMEGRAVHCFRELLDVMEFVPEGYELDADEESSSEDPIEETFPDIDEDEKIEEDETMKWDEDEDEDEESEETEEGFDDDDDDDDDEESDEDEEDKADEKPAPKSRARKK